MESTDETRSDPNPSEVAEARLAAVRAFVDDPGNWSVLDGRRSRLLALIEGSVSE